MTPFFQNGQLCGIIKAVFIYLFIYFSRTTASKLYLTWIFLFQAQRKAYGLKACLQLPSYSCWSNEWCYFSLQTLPALKAKLFSSAIRSRPSALIKMSWSWINMGKKSVTAEASDSGSLSVKVLKVRNLLLWLWLLWLLWWWLLLLLESLVNLWSG